MDPVFESAGKEQGLGWDVGQQGGGDRPASLYCIVCTAQYAVNSDVEATLATAMRRALAFQCHTFNNLLLYVPNAPAYP